MELKGDIYIDAPREQVWRALNDPQVLVLSIPGCEEVEQISPTETHVRAMIKMGPVRARFLGKIVMSEVRPGEGCVLNFEGSGGAAGFAKGASTVRLDSEGAGTRLHYTAQASVGGKLGQIGGRMIDAAAKQTADQFFAAFGQHLDIAAAPASAATAAPAVDATAPAVDATELPSAEPLPAALPVDASAPVAPAAVAAAVSPPASRAPSPAALAPPAPAAAVPSPAAFVPSAAQLPPAPASPSPAASPRPPLATRPLPSPAGSGESVRILWFALGAAATAFGFAVAAALIN